MHIPMTECYAAAVTGGLVLLSARAFTAEPKDSNPGGTEVHSAKFHNRAFHGVIGDNSAGPNEHASGFNGLWSLVPAGIQESMIGRQLAGLNLEHYINGTDEDGKVPEVLFDPRHSPMAFKPLSDSHFLLHQPPTRFFQVESWTEFTIREPNIIDMYLKVEGYACYADYQVFLNSYVAPGFTPVVYLKDKDTEVEQVEVVYNPVYKGMYNLFPRDMAAAKVLYDGRGQSGRHHWWVALGRIYGCAMGSFTDGTVDVVMMGRCEDVQAVGISYAGDEQADRVAAHRGMYLPMFGRDLRPGLGWQTQARMVIDDFKTEPAEHLRLYQEFCDEVASKPRDFPAVPQQWA